MASRSPFEASAASAGYDGGENSKRSTANRDATKENRVGVRAHGRLFSVED
jgi:hypothetical protein